MAESTLALKKSDFAVQTADFLGWGRGIDNADVDWTDRQKAQLKEFVDSAVRQFYWPIVEGGGTYDWTFLKPVATLTLPAAASTLDLPDDFGGMEGRITLSASTSTAFWPVPFVGVGEVYKATSAWPDRTGPPTMACEEPVKGTGLTRGQRGRLHFWPTADQAYTVQFQYYLLPDCLSSDHPYVYGGAAHAETILEGCKAAAELALDDVIGVHRAMFKERLAASMAQDRRLKPQLMAYNADNSDVRRDRRWRGYERDLNPVTFDGVTYP